MRVNVKCDYDGKEDGNDGSDDDGDEEHDGIGNEDMLDVQG